MTFAGEFLGLPGLRGYWPMGAFDSSGNAIDQSGNARTLTYNGNPTYNVHASGGPYIDLDGTGDYLSRADEAGLDIIGTESYVASAQRGLTVGGWFFLDSVATEVGLMAKYNVSQRSFLLSSNSQFYVSTDGTAVVSIAGTVLSASQWYFIVGRYIPSTSVDIYVNGSKSTNTTSVPASLFNSTAVFEVGGFNNGGAGLPNGRAGMCFLGAMALSDTAIDNIYQGTRDFYGV